MATGTWYEYKEVDGEMLSGVDSLGMKVGEDDIIFSWTEFLKVLWYYVQVIQMDSYHQNEYVAQP